MAECRNLLDISYNIGNKILKRYIKQNVAPSTALETLSPGVMEKLGLSWVQDHAPAFYINSKQVKILHEPSTFYNLILKEIKKAKNRIVLASLYLGTGSLEKEIVVALKQRLEENPELKIKILLDCTRGSRGEMNSRKMLLPLLKDHENSCQVSLYKFSHKRSSLLAVFPEKYREIFGLQHIKMYLFDNNFIISGANLSNDYFTNRQDRYIFISDSQELSDFLEGLIERVSGFSFTLNSEDKLVSPPVFPEGIENIQTQAFYSTASDWINSYYEKFVGNNNKEENNTVIFPLIEMGPFKIHKDSTVTSELLEKSKSDVFVDLTTGYFNLTQSYADTIVNKSEAQFRVLTAHPLANGFYKAKGPAGGIPAAYTNLALQFLEKVNKNRQNFRIKMFEYKKLSWTYHAKGLWLSSSKFQFPFLTMVGSPNFGERSEKRDLECQFLLATLDKDLQMELNKEKELLFEHSEPFSDKSSIINDPGRKIPYWVKIVVWLFRTYL